MNSELLSDITDEIKIPDEYLEYADKAIVSNQNYLDEHVLASDNLYLSNDNSILSCESNYKYCHYEYSPNHNYYNYHNFEMGNQIYSTPQQFNTYNQTWMPPINNTSFVSYNNINYNNTNNYINNSNSNLELSSGRRKNATRESTNTLKAWLQQHMKNPYPSKNQKIMLAVMTKMNLTQVSTWFANARRRLKKENKMTWSSRTRSENDETTDEIKTEEANCSIDINATKQIDKCSIMSDPLDNEFTLGEYRKLNSYQPQEYSTDSYFMSDQLWNSYSSQINTSDSIDNYTDTNMEPTFHSAKQEAVTNSFIDRI